MAASETIYGVHENQSVKRSGQAGGAVRAYFQNMKLLIAEVSSKVALYSSYTIEVTYECRANSPAN
ncbi:hypothetical protein E0X19_07460 [Salmonella enterica subsp. enterica serovar Agama]|uniref:Uncharacterized protein n=1 Tax=Salmonella enterica subsp. enterica serovar Agama TaxID=399581 RepID=A0A5I1E536_SALET|nr:hypothetical protein [Salmonella enterica subsp. enterica serovar Agama]EAA9000202.1 hypothetical protein [Salmonella enterica]EAA9123511.1 hypothetical protein [Salmonella enterica subsp. enterica serovar Maastricht]EAB7579171.1 hypothetical protein [Salmonella enterica subsp. enterica]EAB8246677.1 hypothetical protein [Salmonella enterica subsp. enterica serovar Typhimurium]EBH7934557.1 hypothetical protein [Salmonella enterica subsp. enterica serovar Rubislaw]EBQ9605728.1 hypothetical p